MNSTPEQLWPDERMGQQPLISQAQIADIAIAIDAENNKTPDTLAIGMMVVAMTRLQAVYEAKLDEYQAVFEYYMDLAEQIEAREVALRQRVQQLEAQITDLLHLTSLADHAWGESDYELYDSITRQHQKEIDQ